MSRSSGYSLIELLVVISIVAIVFGVGIAGYRDFSRRQYITKIAKQVVSDLRSIQQYALIGQKPSGYTCDTLNGYIFNRVSSSNYTLKASCTNTVGGSVSHTVKDIVLDSGTTFVSTNSSILFKVLGQGTDLTSDNVITITDSSGTVNSIVTVGIGGEVR